MPKVIAELPDVAVRKLRHGVIKGNTANGKRQIGAPCTACHAVGGVSGLLLQCNPPIEGQTIGSRSWILRTMVGNKRREFGLGPYPEVTLSAARAKAREMKADIRQGIDPIAHKKACKSALLREQARAVTFKEIAQEYVGKKGKEFKTAKQVQKLEGHLNRYAFPFIGEMMVADIERPHIEAMLKPIWETKTETATRVRQHVERILDLAGVKGLREGDNPARWKGNLELSLPARNKIAKTKHYAALPVADMPSFMGKLTAQESMGTKALQFIIYTAGRSAEVRGATWDEIDLEARLWRIPAERMKSGKAHTVPLSDPAIHLLESLPHQSDHLFINSHGNPLSDVTISNAPKRLGYNVTAHGFRSTFKDWARMFTSYPDEVSELALAHVNDDRTRAAYARDQLLDKRRLLMAEWSRYCFEGKTVSKSTTISTIGITQDSLSGELPTS